MLHNFNWRWSLQFKMRIKYIAVVGDTVFFCLFVAMFCKKMVLVFFCLKKFLLPIFFYLYFFLYVKFRHFLPSPIQMVFECVGFVIYEMCSYLLVNLFNTQCLSMNWKTKNTKNAASKLKPLHTHKSYSFFVSFLSFRWLWFQHILHTNCNLVMMSVNHGMLQVVFWLVFNLFIYSILEKCRKKMSGCKLIRLYLQLSIFIQCFFFFLFFVMYDRYEAVYVQVILNEW